MIDLILITFQRFLVFTIGLLPDSQGLPEQAFTQIQELVQSATGFNWFLPIEEMLIAIGIIFAFEVSFFLFKSTLYTIHLIRGK
jgi:hypothetical protein